MKGYEHKNIDVDSNTEGDTRNIGIADTSFIFDILFNQMYRDPIGSVIREITSNCFDAHHEAGVTDAVVIDFGDDEGGDYITFTDVGVGLSPERMDKVYMNAGTSTKRDDPNAIGYFGLGSKSPLAYDESFFLTTISDGVKYDYIVHRGTKGPQIQTIDTSDTIERNGTEVKIYIKSNKDKRDFYDKLTYQLRYFDNVYVKNCSSFNNEYTIHEGKNFKFRPDLGKVEMHICVGKVTYPIDWSKLNRSRISLPFGLKFDIGDLPITPEREGIRFIAVETSEGVFTDTVDVVNKKIDALLEELKELRGETTIEYNNLIDWYQRQKLSNFITIAGVDIQLDGIFPKKINIYTPLQELGIEDVRSYPFVSYPIIRATHSNGYDDVLKYSNLVSLEIPNLIDYFIVREFKPINRFKKMTVDYIRYLAKEDKKTKIIFVGKKTDTLYSTIKSVIGYRDVKKANYFETNRLKIWKSYRAIMEREIILHSIDYHEIEVPEDFVKEWEAKNNVKKTVVVEDDQLVVENMHKFVKSDRKTTIRLSDISKAEFVVYGFNSDEKLLETYCHLFRKGVFKGKASIVKVKVKDEKHFISLKNTIYVKALMSDNPVFKKIATAAIVNKSPIWKYEFIAKDGNYYSHEPICKRGIMERVFIPFHDRFMKLQDISTNTVNLENGEEATNQFLEEVVTIAQEKGWIEEETIKDLTKVENYLKGLELFNYIDVSSEEVVPHLINFVKLSGKPINPEWNQLENWQIELISDSRSKADYMEELEPRIVRGYSIVEEFLKRRREQVDTAKTQLQKRVKELNILYKHHGAKERVY